MRKTWLLVLVAVITCAALAHRSSAHDGTPAPVASSFECPVTQPNGLMPPESGNAYGRGWGDYGNEVLWTSLWMWGEGAIFVPNDAHLRPDGRVVELKWAWYRYVPGKLTIEGRRLDAPAPPMTAWIPEGYGESGFQVSGLNFPTDGCWEITGRIEGGSLTFVVQVVYPEGFTPLATPAPEAESFDCPVTKPNGNQPPLGENVAGRGPGGHGNHALWTTLAMWSEQPGLVPVPDDGHLQPDGSVIEMKWAWYRYVPGALTIEGRRRDAPAPPLQAWVPTGYGNTGFQVSGITFPSDGCWEITGRVGDDSLTFVVLVVYPAGFTPVGTPAPQATPDQ